MSVLARFGVHAARHDPHALARAILAQPRFRMQVTGVRPRTWWDALRDWVGDRWNQLIDAFSHHVRIGAKTSVAIGDVLLVAVIVLVLVVAVRLLLGMVRENGAASQGVRELPVRADANALHAAAQEAAARNEYAHAIALLLRAALATLDARGVLRDDPARTVNECRRDVRENAPQLNAPFDAIARAFTAAVYAEDRVTHEQWTQAERAYAAFAKPQSHAA